MSDPSAAPEEPKQAPAEQHTVSERRGLRGVLRSFDFATQGVQEVFSSEKHMRLHFWIALIIALWAIALRLPLLELLFVYSAIVLVIIMEILNTLVEDLVDLITQEWSPRAKRIKDVAAGGVLVACVYACAVFIIVFLSSERIDEIANFVLGAINALGGNHEAADIHFAQSMLVREMPLLYIGITGLVMLALTVVIFKARRAKGKFTSGGWVSGHATLAVYVALFLIFATGFNLWMTLGAVLLSVLVIQSRVEGRIHSWGEVARGALCGGTLALVMYLLGAVGLPGPG